MDLNALLPFTASESYADSIDTQGNIFGTAIDAQGQTHAVEWTPIPEPGTLSLIAAATLLIARRRHAK